jgi:hypothetical protein
VNLYGEVLYNTSREFFFPLQGEEKYCTEGFKELALIYGATEESYRKTVALLNRSRHQEDGGTPSRTIRETTEREGLMIQDYLEQKACTIFQEHGFTPEGQPEESILATIAPRTPIVEEESVNEVLLPYVRPDQSRIDMLKNPVSYEDAKDAVNISVDDVGAKKQKETREQNPHGPPSKRKRAYVHNTVMHVEHRGKFYILNGYGVGCVLRLLLAFLLHNQLLGHTFVFVVDGHSLYSAVVQFFSWYTNMSVILDWYHLRKKCRELLGMALKGILTSGITSFVVQLNVPNSFLISILIRFLNFLIK